MGRRQQIVMLRWGDSDLAVGAIEWGVEWEAAKYEASRRVVPTVPQLLVMLKRAYMEAGRPDDEQLVCLSRYSASRSLPSSGLAQRARKR